MATELALDAYDSEEESPFKEDAAAPKITSTEANGFRDFMLKPGLVEAIAECGFEHPSLVQGQCITQAILGNDILCQAKSGMGKTAVFVLSILQQLEVDSNETTCLVVCHTRELALQVQKEFDRFKKHLGNIRTKVAIGGTPRQALRQEFSAQKPHILIGTPGTLLDLAKPTQPTNKKSPRIPALDLSHIKHFVIDECDQVLDSLELRKTTQDIFFLTPPSKQVLMFTATLSPETHALCKRFMTNPHEIIINEGAKLKLEGLQQYFVLLTDKEKTKKLVELLDQVQFTQAIIFVNSIKHAKILNQSLLSEAFPSVVGFGDLPQPKRLVTYNDFKENKKPILVSTDMFGRGVDFERVNFVINYDMPFSEDTYLHRVGRAGRFGTKGLTVSFVSSPHDTEVLDKVREKFSVPLPELPAKLDPAILR